VCGGGAGAVHECNKQFLQLNPGFKMVFNKIKKLQLNLGPKKTILG